MSHKNLGASSVQVYMIAKKLKIKFTNHIAISILFGILTDTFYFTHSLNDIRPLEAAKDLLSFINKITIDNVYKNLKKRTIDDIKFQKYVLNNMKIKKNVSYFKLNDKNIKKLGIDIAITKKPNLIGNIENVKI
jgi:nanoRNase/pAp phosphatase (c-di-AMP/oligoRNAs hydrolase)